MRWTIVLVVMVALIVILSGHFWHPDVPSVVAQQAQQPQEVGSVTAAQATVAAEQSDTTVQRQEVILPANNEPSEAIISPLDALANYSLDMHTTAETPGALERWFDSKGALLNNVEFRANFVQRWGFSKNARFEENCPVDDALYAYWVARASSQKLALRDALLGLVWSDEHFEIWRRWVGLLRHHVEEGDHDHIVGELMRYIQTYDRYKVDCAARIAVILQWLGIQDKMGAREQELLFGLLFDPKIGPALGDQYGFNLCYLVNRISYRDMAARFPKLLTHPSLEVQWGAVELLRQYVDRGQLNGEVMIEMIPDALVRHLDSTRSAAALELLASFGGQNGLDKVLGIVRDVSSPRRDAALGFLAAAGRIDVPTILEFVNDPVLALPSVGALYSLARRGNESAFTELRRLLHSEREDVRFEAATLLLGAGRLTQEEGVRFGVSKQ